MYIADETGLFYRMKPEYTMEKSGSKASGCKKSEERLTFLFCSNADGTEKLLPLVICFKFKKPRCFTNININILFLDNFSGHGVHFILK